MEAHNWIQQKHMSLQVTGQIIYILGTTYNHFKSFVIIIWE